MHIRILLASILSVNLTCLHAAAAEPSAQQILNRTKASYAKLHMYRDSGLLETVYPPSPDGWGTRPDQNLILKTKFKTHFSRGGKFRYESQGAGSNVGNSTDKSKRLLSYRNGKLTSTNNGKPNPGATPSSLVTGQGDEKSADVVAQLLFPAVAEKNIATIKAMGIGLCSIDRAKRLKEVRVGGKACYRIAARHPDGTMIVSIDKRSFLVRKYEIYNKIPVKQRDPGYDWSVYRATFSPTAR